MPRKEKYISGIYNYCDGWCARCPFTARCRVFAMQQQMEARIQRRDKENAEFWAAMEKAFGDAFDPKMKDDDPFAEDEVEADAPAIEFKPSRERREQHPLAKASMSYMSAVERWRKEHKDLCEPNPALDPRLADALEVIQYYFMFIHVKFCRALNRFDFEDEDEGEGEEIFDELDDDDFEDDEEEEFPKDSDGSAKIAIIAIERSISGWSIVADHLPQEATVAKRTIRDLARLRFMADNEFPKARAFHRPGFDDPA